MAPTRLRRAAGAAVLLLLLALPAASAQGEDVDPTCGAPLGVEAEVRANAALSSGADPEYALVDALRMPGAQRSPEAVVAVWGRLVLVAEVKVDLGTNFTWAVFVRLHSNLTGWNTTPVWMSHDDTTNYYPHGVHIRPSAAAWRDRLWVAWDAQNSSLGGPTDRMVLLRSIDANGSADATRRASETDPNRTTQHPVLAAAGPSLELAYSTSAGDADPSDAHIVVRSFDGSSFGPTVAVSNLSDGWHDALPALASDGAGRLFASWVATNATGQSSRLLFAWREGENWSAPAVIAELGDSATSAPGLASFQGRAFVAYATDYALDVNGSDFEVRYRSFDPASSRWSDPAPVNPEPSNGDDTAPTLTPAGSLLYFGWSTDEDFYYSHGSDTDAVFRPFDGSALGPLLELSEPFDNASDGAPRFAQVGAHLYAHWMVTPGPVPGAPRGDSREGVRLVERPPTWYDGLQATYTFPAVSENGSAEVLVRLTKGTGVFAAPGRLAVRIPNGAVFPLAAASDGHRAWVPVDPTHPDFEVLACGKPLPLEPGPGSPVPAPAGPPLLALAALGAVAAGAYMAFRLLPPRAGAPPRRQ